MSVIHGLASTPGCRPQRKESGITMAGLRRPVRGGFPRSLAKLVGRGGTASSALREAARGIGCAFLWCHIAFVTVGTSAAGEPFARRLRGARCLVRPSWPHCTQHGAEGWLARKSRRSRGNVLGASAARHREHLKRGSQRATWWRREGSVIAVETRWSRTSKRCAAQLLKRLALHGIGPNFAISARQSTTFSPTFGPRSCRNPHSSAPPSTGPTPHCSRAHVLKQTLCHRPLCRSHLPHDRQDQTQPAAREPPRAATQWPERSSRWARRRTLRRSWRRRRWWSWTSSRSGAARARR